MKQHVPNITQLPAFAESGNVLEKSFIAFKIDPTGKPVSKINVRDIRDKLALVTLMELTAQKLKTEISKEIGCAYSLAA